MNVNHCLPAECCTTTLQFLVSTINAAMSGKCRGMSPKCFDIDTENQAISRSRKRRYLESENNFQAHIPSGKPGLTQNSGTDGMPFRHKD